MGQTLKDVLNGHLVARQTTFRKLANAAGLDDNMVHRWSTGATLKPQRWQHLAQAARALGLDRAQTNELFQAAGKPTLEVLFGQRLEPEDRELLSAWNRVNHAFSWQVPVPITRFIGRDEEMGALTAMLAAEREVTVVGFGGYGKTRLALEVARAMQHSFDGGYFIDLAAIRNPNAVIPAIAESIGLRRSLEEPLLKSLIAYFGDVRVLLLLDNVEQVLDSALDVATLLRHTRNLKVLVTSRIPIKIRGEHIFSIDPLPLPDREDSAVILRQNPAVVLFADRAKSVNRTFAITKGTAQHVADICLRLDGLPLAIELAAARMRDVPLASLLERFPSRMEIAASGPRDVDERQRTLRATIAWSFALLDSETQHLFTLLGVFTGGFTEDAAVAIGATSGLSAEAVVRALDLLVVHQLVRVVSDRDGARHRFAMLETIREYAAERLRDSGEIDPLQRAHAMYFVNLAGHADMQGAGQAGWLNWLAVERDNIRAALDWCQINNEREAGLRLSLANLPLWELREPPMDSLARLQAFMDPETVAPPLYARGLLYQGVQSLQRAGDISAAMRTLDEALDIFRREGDVIGEIETLQAVGDTFRRQRDWISARTRYEESLALAQQIGSPYHMAHGYMGLGFCAPHIEGNDLAQFYREQTLRWAKQSGHRATIALATNSLGEAARSRQEWDVAERYYREALRLANEIGSQFRVAMVLHNLGYVAIGRGALLLARERFVESLRIYEALRLWKGQAECLAGLGRMAAVDGRYENAAYCCGASMAMLDRVRAQLDLMDQADFDRTLATLRTQLGSRLDTLIAEGRTMPVSTLLG